MFFRWNSRLLGRLVALYAASSALSAGEWGEPNTDTAADSVVTFNEAMYHPLGDEVSLEWVELHNQMSVNLDVSGWRFEGGIEYQFPTNTHFPAGSFVVVAANPAFVRAQTGQSNVFGPWIGRLANEGETVVLRNQSGRLMDQLTYGDEDPWPVGADGSGASLAKRGPFQASSPAANWRASSQPGGTPGRPNFESGAMTELEPSIFVSPASTSRWIVPTQELGLGWTALAFDDSGWASGTAAVGYDTGGQAPGPIPALDLPDRAYSFEGNFRDGAAAGLNGQSFGALFSTDAPPVPGSAQSLLFPGGAAYARIADSADPTAYTVALWVKPENLQSSSIFVRTDSSGPHSSWSHQLRVNGSGRFEHYLFDGTGRAVAATNALAPGVWRHVAITAASGGEMRIYVDGALSASPRTIGQLWSLGTEWRLGGSAGNAPNQFQGRVDELAIWHSVLSDEAIRALAKGLSPDQLNGFSRYFATDVQQALFDRGSSMFLRVPFENFSRAIFDQLSLQIRYADGFAVFLNGSEIARRNAPAGLAWNSASVVNRADADALIAENIDLSEHLAKIVPGRNVLAVQALNSRPGDNTFLFSPVLSARSRPFSAVTNAWFSEIAGAASASFFLEFQTFGASQSPLAGCQIVSSAGETFRFSTNLPASPFLTVALEALGFPVSDGDRIFLLGRGGEPIDAVEIRKRSRSRLAPGPEAPWYYSSAETPGASNEVRLREEVVINEIMYHHAPAYRTKETPFTENDEQWIELHNLSDREVDLTGWKLDGEIAFAFQPGTAIEPLSYLVVANNAPAMRARHPGVVAVGNFPGRLSHHSGNLRLIDPAGNPADQVRYHNSHPWPEYANGGGSSLELRDPRADNSSAEAWGASREDARAAWKRYSYRAVAVRPVYSPSIFNFHEFRIGLLDEGEALVDNITVTESPSGASARQLLQNPDFSNGTSSWRLLGNHSHSSVVSDSSNNSVLRLVATGSTSYLDNRLETTLKAGGSIVPVVAGREYEISFDAKWVAGSPQLRTELYYNKVVETTILEMPSVSGTPGRRNSIFEPNSGPTYARLSHAPVVPNAAEPIQVIIAADDPDAVASLKLHYSVNGGAWREMAMVLRQNFWEAVIPPQANGAVIQFYIQGIDGLGASSTYPARGRSSRALIKVDAERLVAGKQTFRTIMTSADSTLLHSAINMMSDDLLGCTVVHREEEVFYDARIRLHGSMFSRSQPNLTGMTVKFPAGHRFRGSRESVIVRRRGLVETFVKHLLNSAGGLPGNYDDIVHLVSHRSDNLGTARLNLANYDDTYVDSQFEGDNDGTVFKLEGIREYQTTQNGSPEGLKLSQPIGWIVGFDIANLGDDPEQYRWGIMIQSQRRRDDYSRIIAMGKAFSLSGAALKQASAAAIDVDEWARLFALQSLLGIADVYGVENPHNFAFYVRPSDGRVVGLQNDWEFAFGASASASIYGGKNVYKMLRVPGFARVYQGHLLDLIESVANAAYFNPWTRHYSTVTGESYTGHTSYISSRATSVRGQLAARVPFEITSNGGSPFEVSTPSVLLQGRGWIDVHKIYRAGRPVPLDVTWTDDQRWQAAVPLGPGSNELALEARNYRGAVVGHDSIVVTTAVSEFPQRDYLRVSEIMYRPAPPSFAESAAGFLDPDDFEFLEIMNAGPAAVSLAGARFTAGIAFDFSFGPIAELSPGARALIVRNRAAFEFRNGVNLPLAGVYGGSLSNGGEQLRLVDASGAIILDFVYDDSGSWPEAADGGGRSLVIRETSGNYSDPANWQASLLLGGSAGVAEPFQPSIAAALQPAGIVRLTFQAVAGVRYTLLACDDLAARNWQPVEEFPPGTARTEFFDDTVSAFRKFFRIQAH